MVEVFRRVFLKMQFIGFKFGELVYRKTIIKNPNYLPPKQKKLKKIKINKKINFVKKSLKKEKKKKIKINPRKIIKKNPLLEKIKNLKVKRFKYSKKSKQKWAM